jgi:hypothetical protein
MNAKHNAKESAHRAAAAARRLALVEGRAVRVTYRDCVTNRDSRSITYYPTRTDAEFWLSASLNAGLKAELLEVSLEDQAKSLGLPGVPESWLG